MVASQDVLDFLREVKDPEVPVISVVDLGIIRNVEAEGTSVRVDITPTYSGCPAMQVIEDQVRATLLGHGYEEVEVRTVLSPAWTTDWISEEGRRALREYGIAPPGPAPADDHPIALGATVRRVDCPFCGSGETELRSRFGATACKSLHFCNACQQPFEHFKEL